MGSNFKIRVFIVVLLETSLNGAETLLDCFSCSNIHALDDCHTTKTCSSTQMCYAESYISGGEKLFTLGCRESVFCQGQDVTHMFGRRDGDSCTQCCTLHGCNKYLCPVKFTAAPPPVDGKWSIWGPWEGCSVTCGIGLQSRYRNCDNPPPTYNGRLCLGDAKDVDLCNVACTVNPNPETPVVTITTTTTLRPTTHYNDEHTETTTSKYVTRDLTQAPGECKDLIDCTGYYRQEACNGIYSPWAHRYCPMHCGFCPTASPPPCVDTIDNCHEYQTDVCTNQAFWQWREAHCRKYCDLC